jgi:hypothetical protein
LSISSRFGNGGDLLLLTDEDLEHAREGVVAGKAVGQLEPLVRPVLAQPGKILHDLMGPHAAEHGGKGDEGNFAEMVAGVPPLRGA